MPGPRSTTPSLAPRELFEASLPAIDRVIGSAARRLALRSDERKDFVSWVHLQIIEDDYRVIRGFAGRSSLSTYLTAVVQNLARDYRSREWGRWRPSAAAERLGLAAIQLEILLERDGFSLDEAIEKLRSDHGVRMSRLELVDLAGRLPRRTKASFEGGESLESLPSKARTDGRVETGEHTMTLSRAKQVLDRTLGELDLTDRMVLKMHYESGLRISSIARVLGSKQRLLYTRRDRCVRLLREALTSAGLRPDRVLEALGWGGADLQLEFAAPLPEETQQVPSNGLDPEHEDHE